MKTGVWGGTGGLGLYEVYNRDVTKEGIQFIVDIAMERIYGYFM